MRYSIIFTLLLSMSTNCFSVNSPAFKKLSSQTLLKAFQNYVHTPSPTPVQGYLKLLIGCGHEPTLSSYSEKESLYAGRSILSTPSYSKLHRHDSYLTINKEQSDCKTIADFHSDVVADGVNFIYTLAQNPLYKGRIQRIFFERIQLTEIPIFSQRYHTSESNDVKVLRESMQKINENQKTFIANIAFLLAEKGQVLHHSYADYAASFKYPEFRTSKDQPDVWASSDHLFFGGLLSPFLNSNEPVGLVQSMGRIAYPLGGSADRLFDPTFTEENERILTTQKKARERKNLPTLTEPSVAYCFKTRMPLYAFEKCSYNSQTVQNNTYEKIQQIPSLEEHFATMGVKGFLETAAFCDLKLLSEIFSFPAIQDEKAQCLKIVLDRLASLIKDQKSSSWSKSKEIFKTHFDTLMRYYDQFCTKENPHPQHILTNDTIDFLKKRMADTQNPFFHNQVTLEGLWDVLCQRKDHFNHLKAMSFPQAEPEEPVLSLIGKFDFNNVEYIFKKNLNKLANRFCGLNPDKTVNLASLINHPAVPQPTKEKWQKEAFFKILGLRETLPVLEKAKFFNDWFSSHEKMAKFLDQMAQDLMTQDHYVLGSQYLSLIENSKHISAIKPQLKHLKEIQNKEKAWNLRRQEEALQKIQPFVKNYIARKKPDTKIQHSAKTESNI